MKIAAINRIVPTYMDFLGLIFHFIFYYEVLQPKQFLCGCIKSYQKVYDLKTKAKLRESLTYRIFEVGTSEWETIYVF